jgi:thiol:disulfide interchange protein DsbC
MLFKNIVKTLLLFCLCVSVVWADEAAVKKGLLAKFPGASIKSIVKTPLAGLYEVYMDGDLLYTDDKVGYLFVGNLIDLKSKRNLTEESMQKLSKVKFDSLPLEDAIKVVKGNGKRRIAVFSDPDCPFCKRFEAELKSVNDITIYTFLFPIEGLHSGATDKAKAIWCSPDRAKAWQDWIVQGIAPKSAGSCATPLERIAGLGARLGIKGTPTIFIGDGQRVPGMIPAAKLEAILSGSPAK